MTIYDVMNNSPYLTAFVILCLANGISLIWNRFWRHMNIRKHGYPPPHCDADGDLAGTKSTSDRE